MKLEALLFIAESFHLKLCRFDVSYVVDPFDYFAGQALNRLVVPPDHPDHNPREIAEQAYDYAVEMLKARKEAMQFLSDAGYTYE